jgi:calcineurin-like phosphoesterase family protein
MGSLMDGLFAASGRRTWYTADLHLGHERIIELCGRPFSSVAEMNEAIVTRWNERVEPGDTVWVLGDVALGSIEESLALVSRLHGHKILVAGNHDRCFAGYGTPKQRFGWVERYRAAGFADVVTGVAIAGRGLPIRHALRREFGGPVVAHTILSHFPRTGESRQIADRYQEYRPPSSKRADDEWLLHGHVHNRWTVDKRQINVGVDVWDFAPVPAETICSIVTDGMPDCICEEGESLGGVGVHSMGAPGCALNGGPRDRVDGDGDCGGDAGVEHHSGWPDLVGIAAQAAAPTTRPSR